MEGIALGVKRNILDYDISYEYLGYHIPAICRWAMPYIKEIRHQAGDSTIYCEISSLMIEWKEKDRKNKENKEQFIREKL